MHNVINQLCQLCALNACRCRPSLLQFHLPPNPRHFSQIQTLNFHISHITHYNGNLTCLLHSSSAEIHQFAEEKTGKISLFHLRDHKSKILQIRIVTSLMNVIPAFKFFTPQFYDHVVESWILWLFAIDCHL